MISPINSIKASATSNLKETKLKKQQLKMGSISPYKINSIFSSNISFKGYVNFAQKPKNATFEDTLEENYFQLPQVTLSDGTVFQFSPDESQIECAKALYDGDSVLFNAPTGTGKTAPMHYVATKNLKEGKKTLIVIPLKSLANDKYREFSKVYGEDKIGLLTGDIKLNPNAPITFMTAEIYNNMAPSLNNSGQKGTVIFDEAHYLGDFDRGPVWEYSLINTPQKNFQTLALSATIGNDQDFASWLTMLNPSREVKEVKVDSTERFVPLIHYVYDPEENSENKFVPITRSNVELGQINPDDLTQKQKRALETIQKANLETNEPQRISKEQYRALWEELKENFESEDETLETRDFEAKLSQKYPKLSKEQAQEISQLLSDPTTKTTIRAQVRHEKDDWAKLVLDMKENNMLPAIIFKLSRQGTEDIQQELLSSKINLNSEEEKEEIQKIIDSYKEKGLYLGTHLNEQALLKGFGCHHAGELPSYKKLVEELYSKKLIKVVMATSTLSAGINMPTKSTVIADITHPEFDLSKKEVEYVPLSANELQQMAGRAGRRGIDSIGNVILYVNTSASTKKAKTPNSKDYQANDDLNLAYDLIESKPDDLKSSFRPQWTLMANCYEKNNGERVIENLIDYSFKMFTSKDPDYDKETLLKKFEKYRQVLAKTGFVEQKNGVTSLTPKGRILKLAQCANPLLLSSLIYNEKLKDMDMYELCQVVGHIASSCEQQEEKFMPTLIQNTLKSKLPNWFDANREIEHFEKTKEVVTKEENKLLRAQKEAKIAPVFTDTFGGFCAYLFAISNDTTPNSIGNFTRITGHKNQAIDKKSAQKIGDSAKEFNRKAQEGNAYKVLAQSCSILKRIEAICDFALQNPDLYPNQQYYENLKETADLSLILLKQDPIYDELAL